ncbi:MAG: YeeE/YedE family protein [Stigonema ocellatum SAG 48.90 = DSM 106950]|uniref:YeeE/YedE family protein n=1 Tax=Spirosoma sp. TaxID=1899569 RepID=UPI002626D141|nr:YeeE/YedE thiosulfate transporter family protein [Spirosoma sp.]MBR8838097.1 YeeE/YedE family protein [Stigonema ocellatum SAG 48.90 = DSM 106950]MCX6213888.1 YeeE/YedE thiosulfate transporter family protein [Spirosoma sp.]
MEFLHTIRQPWPWYVAGPLIGLTVPTLLLIGNKSFGISSSLRHICAACLPANISFFHYDWKKEAWNLFFVAGVLLGGFVATRFLANPDSISIAPRTVVALQALGIQDFSGLMPADLFALSNLFTLKGLFFSVIGGLMVGFGTRWAGGCTSGHAIMGLSNLQWPSLVATICFMVGGFVMTHLLLPFIFAWIN